MLPGVFPTPWNRFNPPPAIELSPKRRDRRILLTLGMLPRTPAASVESPLLGVGIPQVVSTENSLISSCPWICRNPKYGPLEQVGWILLRLPRKKKVWMFSAKSCLVSAKGTWYDPAPLLGEELRWDGQFARRTPL